MWKQIKLHVVNKRRDNQKWRTQRNWQHMVHKINKRQRIPKGQSNMENPEKLATYGTQDK